MAENQLNRQLAAGIRAAQQGDSERARELLEGVLRRDRTNEQGWIWLASVVESQRERRMSLERVIKINPGNAPAQQALNSMVGVLSGGEEATIDYFAISAAARTPIPSVGRSSSSPASRTQSNSGNQNFIPLLFGAAIVLGLLLLGSIFIPPLLAPAPTETPIPTEIPEDIPTVDPLYTPPPPTIRPTSTLDPESVAGITIDVTSPATFTPTATLPPTETPLPTATLQPIPEYNFLLMGVQGAASPAIYNVNGDGSDLGIVLNEIDDFDYDPATGLLVFTRRQFVVQPTREVVPTDVPDPDETPSAPPAISLGGGNGALPDLLQYQMFVTNINSTSDRTEVTSSALPSAFAPSISPDGNFIAFASNVDGDSEIYVYDVSTGLSSRITDNINAEDIDPDWSPDGTRLIFSSDRESTNNNDIYIIEPFASDPESTIVQITQSRGRNVLPQWSPATDEFVFININGNETTVRVASIDGRLARDLTFRPDWRYGNPAWTTDSSYILYSSGAPDVATAEIRIYAPLTRSEQTIRTINLDVMQIMPR